MNVFGNRSIISENKSDAPSCLQKPYLRTNFFEGKIEEDIDVKRQCRKNLYPILLASEKQLQKFMSIPFLLILVLKKHRTC